MPQVTEAEVFRACRTLFGPELKCDQHFLAYLQLSGVRSAYRKKAKVVHPDRFAVASAQIKSRQKRLFQDLNQAYQTVQDWLEQKPAPKARSTRGSSRPAYSSSQRHQQPNTNNHSKAYTHHYTHNRTHTHTDTHAGISSLPKRPMQFGLFVYQLGHITFKDLIAAIVWQRQQRPTLGQIACRWGWLSEEEIKRIIKMRNHARRFGEQAEAMGLLTTSQIRTLLFHQRSQQKKIGDYFVEHGLLNEASKEMLLNQLAEHNRKYSKGFTHNYYYFHRR